MDTFKGQENDRLRELCLENNCEVVIVPHNLTNKFQPLDISVNEAAKALKKEKSSILNLHCFSFFLLFFFFFYGFHLTTPKA